jgi:hypothetical protein
MDVYQRRRLVALSALAAIFVIFVLLIRSCGDDDEEGTPLTTAVPETTEPAALSQEDFVSQGDTICLDTNTSLAALESADAAEDATDRAELLAGELSSLQSLTLAPGESGENKLDNFLAGLQEQVQGYDDLITAIERDDATAVAEIQATIDEAAADTQEAAERFGFQVCGDTSQVSETTEGDATDEAADETVPATPTTTAPVTPTTTTPTTPPAEGGGATPEPPADGDDGGSAAGSGGITP